MKNMKMHERIKWARETAHERCPVKHFSPLTQSGVAELLHLKPQSVQQWEAAPESGGTSPRPHRLEKLAELFCVSYPWLTTGEGSPEPTTGVAESAAPYNILTHDDIMMQALEIADGVETRLGIKANPDEKWSFIQNVAALLREKYTRDNIPFNRADIIDIAVALERSRRGAGKKDNDNESATG